MKEFWNQRYESAEYAYGIYPNEYFKNIIEANNLQGRALFPAEGEGRNAVFAATVGFNVTAIDFSEQGRQKALRLAHVNQVNINYIVGDLAEVSVEPESFDLVVLIFAHFNPSIRRQIHQKFQNALKVGGFIILESFSKNHLEVSKNNLRSSGPQNIDLLYTQEIISTDFDQINPIELSETITDLSEGPFHVGTSSVIRFFGQKIAP